LEKILVSACLLGENVRYNGQTKPLFNKMLDLWSLEGRVIRVCPEVAGGLPVPRPAAEIDREHNKIYTQQGIDVTEAFLSGAKKALDLCLKHKIKYALLKESSPSCGSLTIYDGSFSGTKIAGEGATTQLLRAHGIKVFSEQTIDDLIALVSNS
jgi:uncharacterized protein YbbK (DUF523 family)